MKTGIIALRFFIVMTVLTGIIYPLLVTGVAHTFWSAKANGSLVEKNGEIIGSLLISQKFQGPRYFWPRPSAADYNAAASSGSNKGPTNADLKKSFDEGKAQGLPNDLIFASASGLDPHISPEAAMFQLNRIAISRSLNKVQMDSLHNLVVQMTEGRTFGILGEPRVNVLRLNIELNKAFDDQVGE